VHGFSRRLGCYLSRVALRKTRQWKTGMLFVTGRHTEDPPVVSNKGQAAWVQSETGLLFVTGRPAEDPRQWKTGMLFVTGRPTEDPRQWNRFSRK
jgi:hypothetical protein